MMTGPVAFAPATAEHDQLRDAVRSNRLYCDGLSVHRGAFKENGPQRWETKRPIRLYRYITDAWQHR